jgi:hypothetical protein
MRKQEQSELLKYQEPSPTVTSETTLPATKVTGGQNQKKVSLVMDTSTAKTIPDVPSLTQPDVSTRWSLPTKYVMGVGLFLIFCLIVFISRGVLSLIIFAALIAFEVRQVILFLQKGWKMKTGLEPSSPICSCAWHAS